MNDHLENIVRRAKFDHPLEEAILAFFESYKALPFSQENINGVLETYVSLVQEELETPTSFSHFHKMERAPFDFYSFSLDMVRPLLDFKGSKILGEKNLQDIDTAISRKENVILLANHQAEIDPQIISLLIMQKFPLLAESIVFVAGHRVTSDPLAIPFSRGTNLLTIYSKKYIESPPELKADRLRHNAKTLSTLEELLNEGGMCVYVAPSGGRDRYDVEGKVQISPFDPNSVEMFYLLARRSTAKTHLHLLALSTINLLPPPRTVNVELGEERTVSYGPAGLFFGPQLALEAVSKDERQARSEALTQEIVRMSHALFPLDVNTQGR